MIAIAIAIDIATATATVLCLDGGYAHSVCATVAAAFSSYAARCRTCCSASYIACAHGSSSPVSICRITQLWLRDAATHRGASIWMAVKWKGQWD